jgi:hypothetical protein
MTRPPLRPTTKVIAKQIDADAEELKTAVNAEIDASV